MTGCNNISRWALCSAALAVALAGLSYAQAIGPDEVKITSRPYPTSQAVLHVKTELVEISVVPRDAHGRAIPGFQRDDFEIYDERKLRPVKAFLVASAHPAPAPPASSSAATPSAPGTADQSALSSQEPAPTDLAPSRSIALFFDDIHSSAGDFARAKIAGRHLLQHALVPGDRLALFTATGTVSVDYTQDSNQLLAAFGKLQAHPRVPENGISQCPRITPHQAYLIVNNIDPNALPAAQSEAADCEDNGDPTNPFAKQSASAGLQIDAPEMAATSVVRAQAEQTWQLTKAATQVTLDAIAKTLDSLAKQREKRMLVLVSSGFLLEANAAEQDSVIAQALRSGTVIDSLDAKGLYAETPFLPFDATPNTFSRNSINALIFGSATLGAKLDDLDVTMANFSRSTGGLIFRNNNDLDFGFRQIGMTPEITYLLSIEPAHDGKYHHLRLKVRGAENDLVQARPGYFAPANDAPPVAGPQSPIDKAMASTDPAAGLPATVSAEPGPSKDGSAIWVTVHLDIAAIKFASSAGRHSQDLRLVAALLDPQGQIVAGKESEMLLALKDDSFAQLARTGITAKTFLHAPPGPYQLREVIQDAEGKLFASTVAVEVR